MSGTNPTSETSHQPGDFPRANVPARASVGGAIWPLEPGKGYGRAETTESFAAGGAA